MANNQNNSNSTVNNSTVNNVTSNSQTELLAKVTEAAKKLTAKKEDITGEAIVKQLGGAPWSYDNSKVTAESGKVYTRRYIQHNGVDVVRIDNVGKLLDGDYTPTKRGRKAAAPKTKVQELECIIDNLCNFAAEVEGEAHEAEAFRKHVTEAAFIVNLRQTAEAIDKAAAEAAEAEAARMAQIDNELKMIDGLKALPHLIPQYVEGLISQGTFVYDSRLDGFLTPEQKAKYKPTEADNSDNSEAADNVTDNEPTADNEQQTNEPTTEETTAAEADKVANKRSRKTA